MSWTIRAGDAWNARWVDEWMVWFECAQAFGDRTALIAGAGADSETSYAELLRDSQRAATNLIAQGLVPGSTVAFLTLRDASYVSTQWGIWRAGGIATPLCDDHPPAEIEYVLRDSQARIVVVHPNRVDRLAPVARSLGIDLLTTTELVQTSGGTAPTLPNVNGDQPAMIVYTSGTTSRPKGVVTTHHIIGSQVSSLVEAWEWTSHDHILHVLPLHHVHGIINVLCCALSVGATCEMRPRFDAHEVWSRIELGDANVFMAVPTIYARLIEAHQGYRSERQARLRRACERMRLMVSGSAALPVRILHQWERITGHVLLERYGMTELGMALSNPYRGTRRPGHVGVPLPGVQVRLTNEEGESIGEGVPGEIEVRGPNVFQEYYRQPEATRQAFRDGWFRTGDTAIVESGSFRILGRASVDIIKTGGYKVSALEVEEALREHPSIRECAVVGTEDPTWGERVSTAVVLHPDGGGDLNLDDLRAWARDRLAPYKMPSRLIVVDKLPRNALGKVLKPQLREWFGASDTHN